MIKPRKKRMPKEAANYRCPTEGRPRCVICKFFLPPNQCEEVLGKIALDGKCDLYVERKAK